MANEQSSDISGLPQWPKEAKELPGGEPPCESFFAFYIAGALGAGYGFARILPLLLGAGQWMGQELVICSGLVLFPALVGMLVGYLIDRGR